MRQTDSNIREWMTGLMRSASLLLPLAMRLRSAMMLTVAVVAVMAVVSCGSGGGDAPDVPGTTPGGTTPGGTTPGKPDEPDPGLPIAFASRQQEETDVTRTREPLESKVNSFVVYGYKNTSSGLNYVQKVFPGYVVRWSKNSENSSVTNTDGWEYVDQQSSGMDEQTKQTIKYWDMSATAYRYFGVAKCEGEYSVHEIPENGPPNEFQISFDVDATTEAGVNAVPYISTLWFSKGTQDYPDRQFGQPVRLLFLKPFARVRFMFTQSYPDAVLMLENKRFFPNNPVTIVNKCHFTVTYSLTGEYTEETYEITGDDGIEEFTEDYSDTNQRWYNVYAPQNLGAFTLSVIVNGSVKTVDVPAEYMNWLPGYQYTYVFKITDQGGVEIDLVESAFNQWFEMPGSTTVYNW